MGDIVLERLVDSVAAQLGSLLSGQEIRVGWFVERELEKLKASVSEVKRGLEGDEVKNLLRLEEGKVRVGELKDAFYDADDLLDDLNSEALRWKLMRGKHRLANEVRAFFFSSSLRRYNLRLALGIKAIRKRIETVRDDCTWLTVKEEGQPSAEVKPSSEDHQPIETDPAAASEGPEGGLVRIRNFLVNPEFEENVSILAIVGKGGIGKTWLVRETCNRFDVTSYFDLFRWVTVTQRTVVLRDIVWQILERNMGNTKAQDLEEDRLQNLLQDEIRGKRFLLVLDDVWVADIGMWSELRRLLAGGAKGSKILATTRNGELAASMGAETLCLDPLRSEEAWLLFEEIVFKGEHRPQNHERLERIGRDIVESTRGLPLAIAIIGGLLIGKSEEEWLKFASRLKMGSSDEARVIDTLIYGFDDLSQELKSCLVYCTLFPSDYVKDGRELIFLWRAHGFIQPIDERRSESTLLEDDVDTAGRKYLTQMAEKSLIVDAGKDEYGNVKAFSMHDLIYDLAREVSGDEYGAVRSRDIEDTDGNGSRMRRHVATSQANSELNKLMRRNNNKVRTFFLLNDGTGQEPDNRLAAVTDFWSHISSFSYLRALHLKRFDIKGVPVSVGKLKHLRYLDLSQNEDLEILPDSIANLVNLEALILTDCSRLKALPTGITKLLKLQHLDVRRCFRLSHMPSQIGKLTNLQTLGLFVLGDKTKNHNAAFNELSRLNRLEGELVIQSIRQYEFGTSILKDKSKLQSLKLYWEYGSSHENAGDAILEELCPHQNLKELEVFGYGSDRFPGWISQMGNLVQLKIQYSDNCKYLPALHRLPHLKILSLEQMTALEFIQLEPHNGRESSEATISFPALKELMMWNLPQFIGWSRRTEGGEDGVEVIIPTFLPDTMLRIRNCPRLTYMLGESLFMRHVLRKPLHEMIAADGSITNLDIRDMDDIESIQEEFFRHIFSLKSLSIESCRRLKSLPWKAVLGLLTTLETLQIKDCPELDFSAGNVQKGRYPSKLRHLEISGIPGMKVLPEWVEHLTELEHLHISHCSSLEALPKWICGLPSLEQLWIEDCKNLSERCQEETGDDWPKISHILDIQIKCRKAEMR